MQEVDPVALPDNDLKGGRRKTSALCLANIILIIKTEIKV